MNNIFKVLVPATLLVMSSCGEENTSETENLTENEVVNEMEEIDYSDMTMYDFSKDNVDLPFKMMLPLKTDGAKPTIEHNEDVTWKIRTDDKFQLVIEDWGTEAKYIEGVKEELKMRWYIFDLEPENEDDDEILYFLKLKTDGEEGEGMKFAHFCLIKEVNGTYYTIQSDDQGTFSLSRAKDMLRSAKSFMPATEA